MKGDDDIFKSLIDRIKKDYPLTPANTDILQPDTFSLLEKGDGFRIGYCWEIQANCYLFSFYNSYRLHQIDPALQKPSYRSFKYLCCFLTLNSDLPDTLIRPNTMAEKLVNLFTHSQHKIAPNSKFDSKYLVESTNPDVLISRLSKEILSQMEHFNELHVEIRGRQCLLFHLRPANYEDTVQLIEIAKRLLTT